MDLTDNAALDDLMNAEPKVNVLVNAFRADAVHHDCGRAWLDDALSRRQPVGLSELVPSGVLRVLTHPRIFVRRPPSAASAAFVIAQPAAMPLAWKRPLADLPRLFAVRLPIGDRIPDVCHAALAIEHGCEWVTLDHGFKRYGGLQCRHLLDG